MNHDSLLCCVGCGRLCVRCSFGGRRKSLDLTCVLCVFCNGDGVIVCAVARVLLFCAFERVVVHIAQSHSSILLHDCDSDSTTK